MVVIIYDEFEPNIANNIVRFLQTPEAEIIKAYWTLTKLCYRFGNSTRWYEWNRIANVWERNEMRHYTIDKTTGMLLGMCGIVKRYGEWHIWSQSSGDHDRIRYKKIPDSLQGIYKCDDCGYIWIKFELREYEAQDWKTCDELEQYYNEF